MAQPSTPSVPSPPPTRVLLLVIQADGKGVPMVRNTPAEPKCSGQRGISTAARKEAIVTSVYTIAPQVRTPARVVANLFHPKVARHAPCPVCRRKLDRKPSGFGRRWMVKMPPSSALCCKWPNMKARTSSTASP